MFESKLIKEIRNHPCIFDRNHADFKNNMKKCQVWIMIAKKINFPIERCRNRWKSLRDRFVREEMKCMSNSIGNARDGKVWEYYDQMTFMKDLIGPRMENNMQGNDMGMNSTEVNQNSLYERPESPWSSQLSEPRCEVVYDQPRVSDEDENAFISALPRLLNLFEGIVQNQYGCTLTDNASFLQMLSQKLDELPKAKKESAKIYMLNYVHNLILSNETEGAAYCID